MDTRRVSQSIFQKRKIPFIYFPAEKLTRLLEGKKEKKLGLSHFRIFFALVKACHSAPDTKFEPSYYWPRGMRKAKAIIYQNEVLEWLKYDAHEDFKNVFSASLRSAAKKIEIPHNIVEFMAKKATFAEVCVLCVYYLRRQYREGYGRMSYRQIHSLANLSNEVICKSLIKLQTIGALYAHPKTLIEHWSTYRYGRKYYDGSHIGGDASLIKKARVADEEHRYQRTHQKKKEPTDLIRLKPVPKAQNCQRTVSRRTIEAHRGKGSQGKSTQRILSEIVNKFNFTSNPEFTKHVIDGSKQTLLHDTEAISASNRSAETPTPKLSLHQTEAPIIQEINKKKYYTRNSLEVEPTRVPVETIQQDLNNIKRIDLEQETRRAKLFMKVISDKEWRIRLTDRDSFYSAVEKTLAKAHSEEQVTMILKEEVKNALESKRAAID